MSSKYSELPHLVPLPALRGRRVLMEKEYSDHSPAPHFGSLGEDSGGIVVDEKEGIGISNCVCVCVFSVQNRLHVLSICSKCVLPAYIRVYMYLSAWLRICRLLV